MNFKSVKNGVLIAVLLTAGTPFLRSASAFELGLSVGGVSSQPITEGITNSFDAKWGPALGGVFEFSLTRFFGLELGAFYLSRKFQMDSGVVITANTLQIPALFRIWLGRSLTAGAGIYGAGGMGNLKSSSGNSSTYERFGLKSFDYGFIGTAGLRFGLVPAIGILLEARYAKGLANVSSLGDSTSFYHSDFMGLVGLRFGMAH